MLVISSFEAKNRLSAILSLAEAGEVIVITRRNAPVARIVPFIEINQQEARQKNEHTD